MSTTQRPRGLRAPASATGAPRQPLAGFVLTALGHPRYRGDFVPFWRIREAVPAGPHPIGIHRELERLEVAGMVERRRGDDGVEWRLTRS